MLPKNPRWTVSIQDQFYILMKEPYWFHFLFPELQKLKFHFFYRNLGNVILVLNYLVCKIYYWRESHSKVYTSYIHHTGVIPTITDHAHNETFNVHVTVLSPLTEVPMMVGTMMLTATVFPSSPFWITWTSPKCLLLLPTFLWTQWLDTWRSI